MIETTPSKLKNWEKRELVQSFRRQGFSYREILQRIPFSLARSTISNWCKDIELTPEQLDRLDQLYHSSRHRNRLLGSKATQRRRAAEVMVIKTEAKNEVGRLQSNELWLAGLMLYWAEGAKTYRVSISNSDPDLIKFMVRWLKEVCKVPQDRLRLQLHLHSGQNEQELKEFWPRLTGISLSQFYKSFVKKEGSGHRKKSLYYGTLNLQIGNRNLLHKILGWIEGIKQQPFASVAQLAEQLPLKEMVPSSTLGGGTTFK